MTNLFNRAFTVSTAALVGASLTVVAVPNFFLNRAIAQTASFNDVSSDYWARPFIEKLAQEEIIAGFPDGSFKPKQPVTRAQFAAIVRKAFSRNAGVRNGRSFSDVQSKYWAASSIDRAYTTGFLSGYPDGTFLPEQQIPKVQALISLASGLKLDPPTDVSNSLNAYRDASSIPDYAKNGVAAATQKRLVVNYPSVSYLNPNDVATRADVAAFVYQALVSQERMSALPTGSSALAYVVNSGSSSTASSTTSSGSTTAMTTQNGPIISRGTVLPVQLSGGSDVKIVLAPTDTLQTTLTLTKAITNASGQILIPVGSQIQGRFQPVNINGSTQGTQYFAEKLIVNGTSYPITATSDPILPTSQQSISTTTVQGARPTAAAQALLSTILGGNNIGSALGSVLAGSTTATAPTTTQAGVIVVDPSKLMLRLQNDFQVSN